MVKNCVTVVKVLHCENTCTVYLVSISTSTDLGVPDRPLSDLMLSLQNVNISLRNHLQTVKMRRSTKIGTKGLLL